jgi:hypothetical protein
MPRTVRFLTECAGRNKGVTETVNDDTLAASWVDARLAEYIDGGIVPEHKQQPPEPPREQTRAPEGPPVDRMAKRPPKRK